ncbi:MAG: hypothetical protein H6970_10785 [Gammaproteobacteria bacterium]|nr:hypothetical protein [Gammaproteobacteria bacterium]MCP5459344.1 hypothetical protein [Gammaproteobacteria bacterium]
MLRSVEGDEDTVQLQQEPTEATPGGSRPRRSAVGIFGLQAGEDVKTLSPDVATQARHSLSGNSSSHAASPEMVSYRAPTGA